MDAGFVLAVEGLVLRFWVLSNSAILMLLKARKSASHKVYHHIWKACFAQCKAILFQEMLFLSNQAWISNSLLVQFLRYLAILVQRLHASCSLIKTFCMGGVSYSHTCTTTSDSMGSGVDFSCQGLLLMGVFLGFLAYNIICFSCL